jgi:hypothetical protein
MKTLLGALLVLTVAATAAQAAGDWLAFRDPNSAFTSEFPGTPSVDHSKTKTPDGSDATTTQYEVDGDARSMIVADTDLSRFQSDAGKVVDGAVGGLKGVAKAVLSDTISNLDGQVGREIVLTDKDDNHITDRIFFVGGHLYQLLTVSAATAGASDLADIERFQRSFHFSAH